MFAKTVLTEEERVVDDQLGYPRGYGKLCRHAYIQMQGLITPYTEGPPQRFQPYSPFEEEMKKLKEFDDLFPYVDEAERDPANARRHAEFLWQQLDHLGNAGFDPAKFRIDMYGNVVYWNADPASPLAWEVDHWFPHSRGGKTVVGNLRIVQWQVNQKKGTKLEFLVPWWDLQIGISVNQFLAAFSSKNAEFRQRAFALFFQGGENEQLDDALVAECHSWPRHFCERKIQVGSAAAAIVKVHKAMDDTLRVLNHNRATPAITGPATTKQTYQAVNNGTPIRRRWTSDEEEALKRAVQKLGPGNWKEIKELEPMLVNRSTVQIKDKFRIMKGEWKVDKENKEDATALVVSGIQKEQTRRKVQEEEKKKKEEELILLEDELKILRSHNDEEKCLLEELERILAKERKRVEKQRKWSETQSQYRLCLDKMIRDTMHQCVVYKEQARLNQAACNALLARLESQKAACDAAEMDLTRRVKQRESLEAIARPAFIKRTRNVEHTDVGTCVKPAYIASVKSTSIGKLRSRRQWPSQLFDEADLHRPRTFPEEESTEEHSFDNTTDFSIEEDSIGSLAKEEEYSASNEVEEEEEEEDEGEEREVAGFTTGNAPPEIDAPQHRAARNSSDHGPKHNAIPTANCGMKRKSLETNDVEAFLFDDEDANVEESMGDNGDPDVGSICDEAEDDPPSSRFDGGAWQQNKGEKVEALRTRDDEQLDELLQEVLEMKGKVKAAMAEATKDDDEEEGEEERVKRLGKFNLDKWLKKLLLDPEAEKEERGEEPKEEEQGSEEGGGEGIRAENRSHGATNRAKDDDGHDQGKAQHVEIELSMEKKKMKKKKKKLEGAKTKGRNLLILSPWRRRAPAIHTFKRAAPNSISDTSNNMPSIRRRSRGNSDLAELKMELLSSFAGLKLNDDDDDDDESNVGGRKAAEAVEEGEGEGEGGGEAEECAELAFQIECEKEFVEKMRARREREERLKRQRSLGIHPKLQDFLVESPSQSMTEPVELDPTTKPSPSPSSSPSSSPSPSAAKPVWVRREEEGQKREEGAVGWRHNTSANEKGRIGRMDRRHSMTEGEVRKSKHSTGRQLIWAPENRGGDKDKEIHRRPRQQHKHDQHHQKHQHQQHQQHQHQQHQDQQHQHQDQQHQHQQHQHHQHYQHHQHHQLHQRHRSVSAARGRSRSVSPRRRRERSLSTPPPLARRISEKAMMMKKREDGGNNNNNNNNNNINDNNIIIINNNNNNSINNSIINNNSINCSNNHHQNNNGGGSAPDSGFRASLSSAWKKAVRKFDIAR